MDSNHKKKLVYHNLASLIISVSVFLCCAECVQTASKQRSSTLEQDNQFTRVWYTDVRTNSALLCYLRSEANIHFTGWSGQRSTYTDRPLTSAATAIGEGVALVTAICQASQTLCASPHSSPTLWFSLSGRQRRSYGKRPVMADRLQLHGNIRSVFQFVFAHRGL